MLESSDRPRENWTEETGRKIQAAEVRKGIQVSWCSFEVSDLKSLRQKEVTQVQEQRSEDLEGKDEEMFTDIVRQREKLTDKDIHQDAAEGDPLQLGS